MRRKDREVTDQAEIRKFIEKEQVMRVGFCDEGDIYIVPVNYGFTVEDGNYVFVFHGARAGRKFELAKSCPTVGFEIDGMYQLMEADEACDFSAHFQSVIGTGRLSLVEESAEKEALPNLLMGQIASPMDWSYDGKMLAATAVFRLDAEKMSCKLK